MRAGACGRYGASREDPGIPAAWRRAVTPAGLIPGDGTRTTLGSSDLEGLIDQLDEIYPPDDAEPSGNAGRVYPGAQTKA
jgi:hypothetical protein